MTSPNTDGREMSKIPLAPPVIPKYVVDQGDADDLADADGDNHR
jgi:hypothetical protein